MSSNKFLLHWQLCNLFNTLYSGNTNTKIFLLQTPNCQFPPIIISLLTSLHPRLMLLMGSLHPAHLHFQLLNANSFIQPAKCTYCSDAKETFITCCNALIQILYHFKLPCFNTIESYFQAPVLQGLTLSSSINWLTTGYTHKQTPVFIAWLLDASKAQCLHAHHSHCFHKNLEAFLSLSLSLSLPHQQQGYLDQ